MEFWTRVDIMSMAESQSDSGAVTYTPTLMAADVEARLLPLAQIEQDQPWATPEEAAYEVHLRGAWLAVTPRMAIVADGVTYDVRQVVGVVPFGPPTTVLHVVQERP